MLESSQKRKLEKTAAFARFKSPKKTHKNKLKQCKNISTSFYYKNTAAKAYFRRF